VLCPLPRRTRTGALVGFLPRAARPSPYCGRVGVRGATFEACSGFTHITAHGLLSAQGGLCHRAPVRSLADCLSATRSSRLLSRWNLPPLATHAFGAHHNIEAFAVRAFVRGAVLSVLGGRSREAMNMLSTSAVAMSRESLRRDVCYVAGNASPSDLPWLCPAPRFGQWRRIPREDGLRSGLRQRECPSQTKTPEIETRIAFDQVFASMTRRSWLHAAEPREALHAGWRRVSRRVINNLTAWRAFRLRITTRLRG